MKTEEFIGLKFGKLTVIEFTGKRDSAKRPIFKCKCDCGNECIKPSYYLTGNKNPNCGCLDIIGQKFGSLTVLERTDQYDAKRESTIYKCQCECGNIVFISRYKLKRPHHEKVNYRPHCGCMSAKNLRPYQKLWTGIKARCYLEHTKAYERYGARGIKMYEPWVDNFIEFYRWIRDNIGLKPPNPDGSKKYYSLDRINNDGNYEPGNIRWATPLQQNHNRSTNKLSNEIVKQIREEFATVDKKDQKAFYEKYAEKYSCHPSFICAVAHGGGWTLEEE